MDLFLKLGVILFLVLLNGFFVASEFSLVSLRKTWIAELVRKGNKKAKQIQNAQKHLDTYISATQLGITLASLALGWVGEPYLAHVLERFGPFVSHSVAIAIAFSIITILHIVLGELAPKSIALLQPEKTSMYIITPLLVFSAVFKPVIYLLNAAGFLLLRMLGFKNTGNPYATHSVEEIKMLLSQSTRSGLIEKAEAEMVYKVFKLGDLRVKHIMVPRKQIIAFDAAKTLAQIEEFVDTHTHSRFPVYTSSIHNIIGFIHIKDIFKGLTRQNAQKTLAKTKFIRQIIRATENMRADDMLLEMRKKRVHIAALHNTSHRTTGIITLEDIVESLVGEIEDEFEPT